MEPLVGEEEQILLQLRDAESVFCFLDFDGTLAAVVDAYQKKGVPMPLAHGHEVSEIRLSGANKRKTVCRLLAAHAPAALAVFIGDDQTDEDAFGQLPAAAITIRVGVPGVRTLARYQIEDPGEVHRFLRAMLEQRRRRGRAPVEGRSDG